MKLKKVLFATLALALGLNLAACQKAVKNTGTEKKTETSAQTKVKACLLYTSPSPRDRG